jgi:RNA polymerase sigma-70 factor (ECF subfamily)
MSKISLDNNIERELVAKAQKDPKGFSKLYEHYYPYIKRYFAAKLFTLDIIEDLTSTTFEKALKNIGSFSWQGYSFSAWLYKIAHNTLIDYFRKQGRQKQVGSWPEQMEIADVQDSLDDHVQLDWENKLLNDMLWELPKRDRQVIYMKFFDGYTNKLIAEKTGLSETNIGTIIHRAIERLRKSMLLSKLTSSTP